MDSLHTLVLGRERHSNRVDMQAQRSIEAALQGTQSHDTWVVARVQEVARATAPQQGLQNSAVALVVGFPSKSYSNDISRRRSVHIQQNLAGYTRAQDPGWQFARRQAQGTERPETHTPCAPSDKPFTAKHVRTHVRTLGEAFDLVCALGRGNVVDWNTA